MSITNILSFRRSNEVTKPLSVPAPTDNALQHFRVYLDSLVRALEFYHNNTTHIVLSVQDRAKLHATIVRGSYTILILEELIRDYGDELPPEYDFAAEMTQLIAVSRDTVEATKTTAPLSISMVVEVHDILKTIVEKYYFTPLRRPFWRNWF